MSRKPNAWGLRSRAAFKLIELDDRYGFLKPGMAVIDLGCAPGGWTQVAVERVRTHAEMFQGDFMADETPDQLMALLAGPADAVLSDMAANTTGHSQTDHLRIIGLAETALDFAVQTLSPGGVFVAKVFSGGAEGTLLAGLKASFSKVAHFKPPSSRKESAEMYVVAMGFKGRSATEIDEEG